jgi:hypothetical protein
MDRRTFLISTAVSSLVPLLASAAIGASANRKGFMLGTGDIATIRADIARIADLGGTIVRFPLYFSFEPSLQVWFDRLEAAYAVSYPRSVILVIDIHHPSNLQSSTIPNVDDFVNKWSAIAQRFANRGRIWYDLCNEPQSRTPQNISWRDIAFRAAQAIRKYDTQNKIVFAAPGTTTTPARSFAPLPGITNQVLQFHFYNWGRLQGGVTPAYPSGNYTQATLRGYLEEVRDAGRRHNMPVYIGEVAINRDHPNASRFLRDFTSLCDEFGIHLTIHAYREAGIWDYEGTRTWCVLENWLRPGQGGESCPRFAINTTVTETNTSAMNRWTLYTQYYLARYPDLRQAFGNNLDLATQHWFASGILEGRMPNPYFSAIAYLNRYADLRAAFGASNYTRAAVHWLDSGIQEGRIGI